MKLKIKNRILNTKNKRIYLQDKELCKTKFKAGENYRYIYDIKENSLVIIPDITGPMKISKRVRNNKINPVIDIRNQNVLVHFQKYDFLEVQIFEDEIIIKGLNNDKKEKVDKSSVKKIINFGKHLRVKEEVCLKKEQIEEIINRIYNSGYNKAVNSEFSSTYQQISIDDIFYNTNSTKDIISKTISSLKVVSLCSGAGILDKGFKDQGFDIIYAIDNEKDMVETYRYNLGSHAQIGNMANLEVNYLPQAEVLIAGTPCQDLSNANRHTGKILDTPKNFLIRKFIEIANGIKSLKVFVLENVPQLLTKGVKFVEELKDKLSDFEITVNKVNSADFGSAQKRERVIIIGSKIEKIEIVPPRVKLYKTVRQAFLGLNDSIPNQLDYSIPRPETLEKIKLIPEGGNFKCLPDELKKNYGERTHSCILRRLSWDEPSITLPNIRKSNILHPSENRQLSVREAARLFDVPDSFIFKGSLANKQQMICNAVPLTLANAIAKEIREKFEIVGYKLNSY